MTIMTDADSRVTPGTTMPLRHRPSAVTTALIAIACAVGAPAAAQEETRYWSRREINFPVPVDRLPTGPQRPAKLIFHVRPEGGSWKQADSRAPDNLELVDRDADRRGFRYTAPADGTYEFCLQQELASGERVPRDGALTPQYRVVFDTKPPVVNLSRAGNTGLQWDISDDNLRDDGVKIEYRWAGRPDFIPFDPGYRFKPRDKYTWAGLQPRDRLEVRVLARDKANLTTSSEIVTLSLDGDGGRPAPRGEPAGGVGGARPAETNPGIEYSASRELKILSKVQTVTRSGIRKSHLFVRTPETNWQKVKEKPEEIEPEAKDPTITWNWTAERDGRYGFIVIPENGAGGRDPDPRDSDPAQFLIEVDTRKPVVTEVAASPHPGPGGMPQVEITWKAEDDNLDSHPIRIEYSESGDPNGKWVSVNGDRGPLPNTGRFTWTVGEDVKPWKFFVRVSATDLAKLSGSAITKEPAKIDLATPKATIETIAAANGKQSAGATNDPIKATSANAPAEMRFTPPTPKPTPAPKSKQVQTPSGTPAADFAANPSRLAAGTE